MKEHIKFDDLLERLLNILEINAQRLSKAINVDRSLVTKWMSGARIPSIHSDYLQKIAVYLKLNIKNSYQQSEIENTCFKIVGTDKITDIENLILVSLCEARGYSKKVHDVKSTSKPKAKNNVTMALSTNDQILYGYERIYLESIALFEAALNSEVASKVIYIKYDYSLSYFKSDTEVISKAKYNRWSNSIGALLHAGWDVNILLNISDKSSKTIEMLRVVFDLIKYGKIHVNYINNYAEKLQLSGIIVVTGVGAIYTLPYDYEKVDFAFSLRTVNAVDVIMVQMMKLIKDYSKPLFNFYSRKDVSFFSNNIIFTESVKGTRLLYRTGISTLLIPEMIFSDIVTREFQNQLDVQIAIQDYEVRKKSFYDNIVHTDYFDYYWNVFFTQLIYENTLDIYTHLGIKKIKVSQKESMLILDSIVEQLQTLKHYHIYVLHDTYNSDFIFKDYSCLLKVDTRVYFERITSTTVKRMSIEEPTIINIIKDYFFKITKNIAPIFKTKDSLIRWINESRKFE